MDSEKWDKFISIFNNIKQEKQSYALVLFNIKNFRYYNATYGYKQGDEILQLILDKMKDLLYEDEYIVNIYADSYVLLFKYESQHTLVYDRIIGFVDKVYRIEDERIYRNIFLSCGIYLMTDPKISFDEALNLANITRKESDTIFNRSFCIEVHDENFYNQYMDRVHLETATAEAYKNFEFFPYLQPKVNPFTNEIVGAEALLRWKDKDGNLVPLYKFLPILNQNSYIQLVDLDIFDMACKYLSECIENNKKVVPISFNISKSYFYNPTIVKDYIKAFEKYTLPKELIEIELMESISLDDTKRLKEVIKGFRDYGFNCVLDDFGNGYSSFNVLLNADLQGVKMDRQFFVDNLNGDSRLIIKTVIDLIKSLNMEVVAEGVEDKEHVDYLMECGCDIIQGYYFYKPISLEEFDQILHMDDKKQG